MVNQLQSSLMGPVACGDKILPHGSRFGLPQLALICSTCLIGPSGAPLRIPYRRRQAYEQAMRIVESESSCLSVSCAVPSRHRGDALFARERMIAPHGLTRHASAQHRGGLQHCGIFPGDGSRARHGDSIYSDRASIAIQSRKTATFLGQAGVRRFPQIFQPSLSRPGTGQRGAAVIGHGLLWKKIIVCKIIICKFLIFISRLLFAERSSASRR